MKKLTATSIILFLFLNVETGKLFCKDNGYKSFNKYFTLIDTVFFNIDSLIIGDIDDIIVLNNGKYVIKDPISRAAFWVDTINRKYKKLSFEKELPGVDTNPLGLYRDLDGGFWESIVRYYLKFDENGNLLSHYSNDKYFVSDKFCVDSTSNLIIYSRQESLNGIYLLYYNLKNNDIHKLFKLGFSKNYINIIKRFDGGGFLIDKNNYLYVANAIEDKIYKYDLSGNLIKCFSSKNVPFKHIDRDIPPGKAGVIDFLMRSKGKLLNTIVNRIGFINSRYIFANYIGSKDNFIEIFSKDGDVVNKKLIKLPKGLRIVGSANNCIYASSLFVPEEKPDEIQNSILLKYKFNQR